jgi:hypothetical protein
MWGHGSENAALVNYTDTNGALPPGSQNASWNNGMIEAHYLPNPQLILTYRFDTIRMSQQGNIAYPDNAGNTTANTVAFRYYPFMTSRAGFALHGEFSHLSQKNVFSTSTGTLADQSYYSVFAGMDYIF